MRILLPCVATALVKWVWEKKLKKKGKKCIKTKCFFFFWPMSNALNLLSDEMPESNNKSRKDRGGEGGINSENDLCARMDETRPPYSSLLHQRHPSLPLCFPP